MSKIKDLEILKQYLSEEELKEIAKNAAYDLFKNSISQDHNKKYSKDNINYYATQGAMLAMAREIDPIRSELQSTFNNKVKSVIKQLSWYNIDAERFGLNQMIQNSVNEHSKELKDRVNMVLKESYLCESNDWNDKLYNKVYEDVGTLISEIVDEALKLKYKKDEQN